MEIPICMFEGRRNCGVVDEGGKGSLLYLYSNYILLNYRIIDKIIKL